MDNPLELPLPDDPIKKIEALARDLAFGAIHQKWGSTIRIIYQSGREYWEAGQSQHHGQLDDYLKNKWQHNHPSSDLLLSFSYFSVLSQSKADQTLYCLTSEAFALLKRPVDPPKVFISYKQDQSSALGLLIEARLKLADPGMNVFIDKLIDPGDEWEERLEKTIRQSSNFICVIGNGTLESETVQKEIEWAFEAGCYMIPIWHHSYDIKTERSYPEKLMRIQAIPIPSENAKGYESAINDLLIKLGYPAI